MCSMPNTGVIRTFQSVLDTSERGLRQRPMSGVCCSTYTLDSSTSQHHASPCMYRMGFILLLSLLVAQTRCKGFRQLLVPHRCAASAGLNEGAPHAAQHMSRWIGMDTSVRTCRQDVVRNAEQMIRQYADVLSSTMNTSRRNEKASVELFEHRAWYDVHMT